MSFYLSIKLFLKALVNDKIINNMARRTIIDHKTGFTNEFATEDDKVIYHTTQDVAPVIEHCKALAENKPAKICVMLQKYP